VQQAEIDALLTVMAEVGLTFNPQVLRRGIAYFEQGRVRFERSDDDSVVRASVRGDETHTVCLNVGESDDGRTQVSPTCDCAAGMPCKHVAAAFFGHMVLDGAFDANTRTSSPREDRDVTQVVELLASFDQGNAVSPEPARATLKFSLSLEPGSALVALRVSGRVCTRLQSGAWSRGKRLALIRPVDVDLPEEQLQLLDLFISLQGSLYNSRQLDCRLPTPLVSTVLRRLLALGIGEVGDAGRALTDGGVCTLEPAWIGETSGKLGLKLSGTELGDRLRLVRSDNGFWYVDRLSGQTGPVRSDLSDRQVLDLMQLPALDAEQRREVEAQIPNLCRNEMVLSLSAQARNAETLVAKIGQGTLTAKSEPGRGYALYATVDYPIGNLPLQPGRERSYDPDKRRWQARDQDAELNLLRDLLDSTDVSLLAPDGRTYDSEELADQLQSGDAVSVLDAPATLVPLDAQLPVWADHPGWIEFSTVTAATLREQGWRVELPDELRFERHDIVELQVDFQQAGDAAGWFSVGLTVEVGGESVALLPLLARWLQQHGLRTDPLDGLSDDTPISLGLVDQRELRIPAGVLRPLIANLADVLADVETRMQMPRAGFAQLDAVLSELPTRPWNPPAALRQLANGLQSQRVSPKREAPPGFNAELRPYQREGLGWLRFLADAGMGGILADDMGLGKTVQTLAHILDEKQDGRLTAPVLVVTPTSVVGNWVRECAAFVPMFRVVALSGPDRKESYGSLDDIDIAIASYAVVQRDIEALVDQPWSLLVLDEAQWVKKSRLPRRTAPFILRRNKDVVARDLPARNEMVQRLELTAPQKALYEAVRALMESRVRDALFSRGLAGSQIMVLDALLKLRQACCDPRLLPPSYGERESAGSAKLDHLLELVETLQTEKRSVLVFSQFATMLDLIGEALDARSIPYVSLTGRSRRREELIDRFQSGEVGVFLISLKAGGVGLNLTRADTVVLFDPWWNPAAEQQAIDRAHRIGQTQTVFVYRLIAASTVEEKILELQARKRALASGLVERGDSLPTELTEDQVIELLQPVA